MLNGSDDEKYYNKKTIELWMQDSDKKEIKEEKEDTMISYLLSLLNLKCFYMNNN